MEVIKDHNVNTLNLLRNKDFVLINHQGIKITFKVPNLEDYITDRNLLTFLSLLEVDRAQFSGLDVSTNYKMLVVLINNNLYTEEIVFTLNKYIPNIIIKPEGFYIDKNKLIAPELDFIILAWKIALGSKTLEDIPSSSKEEQELDEFEKKIKEKEEKIKKIKSKAETNNLDIEKVLITVMKEFTLKMEDLLPMNMYTLFWYYKYGLKYGFYRIETVAAGNGLLKKHKHFSE
jgi:large-conductance mechanosensitive channel